MKARRLRDVAIMKRQHALINQLGDTLAFMNARMNELGVIFIRVDSTLRDVERLQRDTTVGNHLGNAS